MATSTSTPATTSTDYDWAKPKWDMVDAILGGTDAMRAAGEAYLPKPLNESETDYEYRRANAKFTNIYADVINTLSAKPFDQELTVEAEASEAFKAAAEDIDGRGNNLHVFASQVMFGGVNKGIDWILVDYPATRPNLTLADQRRGGIRPYWVRIPAERMLAVYTATINGREEVVHARIREDETYRDGWLETSVQRVRVFDRAPVYDEQNTITGWGSAIYQVWQAKKSTRQRTGSQWEKIDEGPITIGVIPLARFIAGRRVEGSWRIMPPMQDVADLQVAHYRLENQLWYATEMAAFPMLAANGVQPPVDASGKVQAVPVGPKTVLYAPPFGDTGAHGEWTFIEPEASSLEFLAKYLEAIESQMREIGRQPLMGSAGITVVAAAFASQKANSLLQAWALGLKDTLEQALVLTAKWLNEANAPSIAWNIDDLDVGLQGDDGSADLLEMRKNGDLSQETLWAEMRGRGKLSPDFDPDKERERLAEEALDPGGDDLDAAITPPANDPEAQPDMTA